jgi:hypothetical protein
MRSNYGKPICVPAMAEGADRYDHFARLDSSTLPNHSIRGLQFQLTASIPSFFTTLRTRFQCSIIRSIKNLKKERKLQCLIIESLIKRKTVTCDYFCKPIDTHFVRRESEPNFSRRNSSAHKTDFAETRRDELDGSYAD